MPLGITTDRTEEDVSGCSCRVCSGRVVVNLISADEFQDKNCRRKQVETSQVDGQDKLQGVMANVCTDS